MPQTEFDEIFRRALEEDFAQNDITTLSCVEDHFAEAIIKAKQSGTIAGLLFVPRIFEMHDLNLKCELLVKEGTRCKRGMEIARITGSARSLLSSERSVLNLLQHLSGIATLTAKCVRKVSKTKCQILDTRKTAPGLRSLQKYAVKIGGGVNHRLHLSDQILIKNNHLALAPSLSVCIERAKKQHPKQMIEVEVETLGQLEEAIKAKADAALLDNMTPAEVAECVKAANGRIILEASGGIRYSNLLEYAKTGVDRVSIGALTHSAKALDLSMKIKRF